MVIGHWSLVIGGATTFFFSDIFLYALTR